MFRSTLLLLTLSCAAPGAIPLSTGSAYTQTFDAMGTSATATLPTDFRADRPATVRTVGTFAAALTATTQAGSANISTSAANGIYNFGNSVTATDRAVGFISSGTATQSGNLYAQFVNNTGAALTGVQLSYGVEKYRHGLNPAGFRVQLFYSLDGTNWTSAGAAFLTSFAADADNTGSTPAPGSTTAISAQTLSVAIPDGSSFYLAWNYSVASGTTTTNAQGLGIDDISVLGLGNSPTNPTGVGAANPSTVQAGSATLLTVAVAPGTNPASTGIAVSADLTSIGGGAAQQFFDDGTHGDLTAGDNTFSFQATVSVPTTAGVKTIPASITDAQGRSNSASIGLTVTPFSTPPSGTGSATPGSLLPGATTLLRVTVTAGSNPVSTGITVSANLSAIGGSTTQQFFDDGSNGDATAGDSVFSFLAAVAGATSPGSKSLAVTVSDGQGRSSSTTISVTVQSPPPPNTVKISQVYGGGGNSGSTYQNDFIEIFNQASTPIDVSTWSVQYATASQSNWQVTPVCETPPCVIAAGHYFLVQESQGTGGTTTLPAPDASGSILMGAGNGQVALVANTTALTGVCPTGGAIADFVGYGLSGCPNSAGSSLTNTTADVRKGNGCVDTDNTAADFVAIAPIPRNSSAPANSCVADPAQISGLGTASPAGIEVTAMTLLTVRVTPATNPPSTNVMVVADISSLGGSAAQAFFDDGTHGDQTAGDNVFSVLATVSADISTGVKFLTAHVTDGQNRSAEIPITVTVQSPTCGVEYWNIKTGTDADALAINLNNVIPTTIADLRAIPIPYGPIGDRPVVGNAATRIAPTEFTVYRLNAMLTLYKLETDVDYHMVLQDENGNTLVGEVPSPACVTKQSPFLAGVMNARGKSDARLTPTDGFQSANVPVQITGVGFFDIIHGQTGVAPNGIELHPILDVSFTTQSSTQLTSGTNPSQFGQAVTFTAMVSNGGVSTPTGNVTFLEGATTLGTVALDGSGSAMFTTSTLPVGSHTITSSYEGDSKSTPSKSTALTQTVNKGDQTITFAPLPDRTYGDPPFVVTATGGGSGSAVAFSAGGNCSPGGVDGATITITGGGSCTVTASQAGDSNYNAATPVVRSFTIHPAPAHITAAGYSGTYDALPHTGTVSAAGINNEDLGALLTIGPAFVDAPGGTDTWTFAGNANYAAATGMVAVAIGKATPSFTNLSSPSIALGATPTNLGGTISSGALVPPGSVSITLNSVTQSAAIGAGGNFASSFSTGALAAVNPPYAIAYSYAGDTNFNAAGGAGTLTIGYGITALYDSNKSSKAGSTVPLKFELTDAGGNNVSSPSIVVTAVQLVQVSTNATTDVQDAGNANPDSNFRFDAGIAPGGGYVYNLSTKDLAIGTWQLNFSVAGDPVQHSLLFQLR